MGKIEAKPRSWAWLAASAFAAVFALQPTSGQAGCADGPRPGVDWSGCEKQRVILRGKDLSNSNFDSANLSLSDFQGARLNAASFVKTKLEKARLSETILLESNFEGAQGDRAMVQSAKISAVQMSKSEFPRADFSGSELSKVDLSKSDLARASFDDATLKEVDLSFANLSRVAFTKARLQDVSLHGAYTYLARIEGVDLRGVSGLVQLQLDAACGDNTTKLPQGLEHPKDWPCAVGD